MNTRISHLHRKAAEWLKLNSWVPEAGEFIVYDPDENFDYARVKVGDGKKTLQELDFFADASTLTLIQKQRYFETLDAGRVTDPRN